MASLADSLPDDVDALRAIALASITERDTAIAEREAERAEKEKIRAERDAAIALNEKLRHLLHKANDALYGSKSERLAKLPPDQLHLALEDIEQAIAKNDAVEDKRIPGTAAS